MMVDGELYGRVTPERFDAIVARVPEPEGSGLRQSGLRQSTRGPGPSEPRSPGPLGPGYTVYVPRDAAALSLGAEDVARAIAAEAASRGLEVHTRNGTRGMCCSNRSWKCGRASATDEPATAWASSTRVCAGAHVFCESISEFAQGPPARVGVSIGSVSAMPRWRCGGSGAELDRWDVRSADSGLRPGRRGVPPASSGRRCSSFRAPRDRSHRLRADGATGRSAIALMGDR
jgi:hypothetical protein